MTHSETLPLILGGHSFIAQLGLEPKLDPQAACDLVAACLDRGIRCFDTTYQPERIALGAALNKLGRRNEAEIIAWNFFTDFGDEGEPGGPRQYAPDDIKIMQDQLQTDFIDMLTLHSVGEPNADDRQQALAGQWVADGLVGHLGLWSPGDRPQDTHPGANPFSFAIQPGNIFRDDADAVFAAADAMGWEAISCSPFVRGWKLRDLAREAVKRQWVTPEASTSFTADLMLRYCLHRKCVTRTIIAMRKVELVAQNAESTRRGPLSADELSQLQELRSSLQG